ncbi:hypothetical protein Q4Q35_21665 [Flavivirga aquimarina]|uniref:Disease resistance R13L4/SHOC-2-like LRR domain-containing protein n=1 Tax=Flavivirga aquimarina TaxID=2027862 RepID=A0ABT8WGY4_9FLAO|nr:hypothetical protein [Flavivirga aquimarina]MDO5972418.1 hypothetical protein [Flavivirga aquimarina]
MNKRNLLLFIVIISQVPFIHSQNQVISQDSSAVVNFHNALVDDGWPIFWDVSKPVSSYTGITVNASGRISQIEINGNTLGIKASHLPDGIEYLKDLQGLTSLIIQNVLLETISPKIGELTSLQNLILYLNYISVLPDSIGDLQNLSTLNISYNRLSSLPSTLGDLDNLASLYSQYNKLKTLPDTLSKLEKLVNLNVSNNELESFPLSISEIQSLREIRASYNEMSGEIPETLWDRDESNTLYALPLSLYVDHNNLSGRILGENTDEDFVEVLNVSHNKFLLQDLLPDYEALQNAIDAQVTFMPQDRFGDATQFIVPNTMEETTDIFVEGYQPVPSNVVEWISYATFNDKVINEKQSGMGYPLAKKNDLENGGFYYCKITNPAMPGYEIISEPIRFILSNKPPKIITDAITFRKGENPELVINTSDDYSYSELIKITYTNETENLDFSSGNIIPKEADWTGTNSLLVTATDEQNAVTKKEIPITILPTENTAPLVTLPETIYPVIPEGLLPLSCEPQTSGCDAFYMWEAYTLIDYYIKDDLNSAAELEYTIKEWNGNGVINSKVYVDIFDSSGWVGHSMQTLILANKDTIVNYTLQVKDREGLTTEHPVRFICSTITPSKPPIISEIPDQIITSDVASYPNLNLNDYLTNDYERNEDILWLYSNDVLLNVDLEDNIALVEPSIRDTPFTTSIDYIAVEKTNMQQQTDRTVNYIFSETLGTDVSDNEALNQEVVLYPNPARNGKVYMRFFNRQNIDGTITIFNITGQSLLTFPFHNTTGNLSLSPYIDELFNISQDKLYFIKTTFRDGSSSVSKLLRM